MSLITSPGGQALAQPVESAACVPPTPMVPCGSPSWHLHPLLCVSVVTSNAQPRGSGTDGPLCESASKPGAQ